MLLGQALTVRPSQDTFHRDRDDILSTYHLVDETQGKRCGGIDPTTGHDDVDCGRPDDAG